jgi:hypothetical protein
MTGVGPWSLAMHTFESIDRTFRSDPLTSFDVRLGRNSSIVVVRDPRLISHVLRDDRGYAKLENSPFRALAGSSPFTEYERAEHLAARKLADLLPDAHRSIGFLHKVDYLREFRQYPPTLLLGAFDYMRSQNFET